MTSLSLLALLGRIFDPLAALLDEAATSASARGGAGEIGRGQGRCVFRRPCL